MPSYRIGNTYLATIMHRAIECDKNPVKTKTTQVIDMFWIESALLNLALTRRACAVFAALLSAISMEVAAQQQMFPAKNGTSCPSGSNYKGSGYCQTRESSQQFFPAKNGTSCPSGSNYKGSGYCQARESSQQFFPAKNGTSCPSGTQYAGSGFCKTR